MKNSTRKYSATLDKELGRIIREAAREWLRAVLTSVPSRGGFPVVTGAAKSTLVPLGRILRVSVPVRPQPDKNGYYRGDRRAEGQREQKFRIVDDNNKGRKYIYSFEWSTTLLHYYLNEFGLVHGNAWESVERGREAFMDYVNSALRKMKGMEIDNE